MSDLSMFIIIYVLICFYVSNKKRARNIEEMPYEIYKTPRGKIYMESYMITDEKFIGEIFEFNKKIYTILSKSNYENNGFLYEIEEI